MATLSRSKKSFFLTLVVHLDSYWIVIPDPEYSPVVLRILYNLRRDITMTIFQNALELKFHVSNIDKKYR